MSSPFYARIKGDVLRIVQAVPPGRVVSFAEVGAHLDVMPRHVAYILSMLSDIEKATLPWHRVVGADGRLGVSKAGADGAPQRVMLVAEGAAFDPDGRMTDFVARSIAVASLQHGVPPQTRPADAPVAKRRR
ncbi:MGMT family protein [Falsiroseomonas tokyonensis]|uniref:MGMT family protein n=1 Tax=Falsiroseomonas tokyonensis TaxID=430521 RepID=A0ABV7BTS6_9PROT|nr:MGMT family protein [Falsiroseomonas tokyonensis]MBU8538599.1 MGMT family protein [Falsiroseomonas tokyonensis]